MFEVGAYFRRFHHYPRLDGGSEGDFEGLEVRDDDIVSVATACTPIEYTLGGAVAFLCFELERVVLIVDVELNIHLNARLGNLQITVGNSVGEEECVLPGVGIAEVFVVSIVLEECEAAFATGGEGAIVEDTLRAAAEIGSDA